MKDRVTIPQSLVLGLLVAACGWFGGVVVDTWQGHGQTSQQVADSKDCRDQLIEARNRENACRDRCTERSMDDLRLRMQALEHPTKP